jgi:peptidoglycan L-alanyl-D-glutamate endopeptidase CwlK
MSVQLLTDDVTFIQRMLCSAGCYAGPADGTWTTAVDEADRKLQQIADEVAAAHGRFDERSERNIRSLHPRAQAAARAFLVRARAAGLDARIISGTRTYAEQNALYRIGRNGDTRPQVTRARGGESNHNFGFAWDIGLFDRGKYLTDEASYRNASVHCPAGCEWGGNWARFPDPPHYQLAVGKPLKDVRACFETGRPFVDV